ncbi:MAG: DsbA family protein [Nitrosopumilaceae archaeon]|nr:DsbA family protein [Nitrosopumilaceae archaeon]
MRVARKKAPVVAAAIIAAAIVAVVASVMMEPGTAPAADVAGDDTPAPYPDRVYGGIDTSNGSPILGDPSAPVTIVEFGDYQCHFCEIWHSQTLPPLVDDFISTGKAKLVFVDFAFLGKDSPGAAQASHCAGDQGMYWEYHDMLYESQQSRIDGGWASLANLRGFAVQVGLDIDTFNECMSSKKYAERVSFNVQTGAGHGVEATPTFFVVGGSGDPVMIPGAQPYGTFIQVINSLS